MRRSKNGSGGRKLGWLVILLCLLLTLAVAAPTLLQSLRGKQFRLNPNARLRDEETYRLTLWVERPSLADPTSWQQGLEQSLAEFHLLYPNIEVTLTQLTPDNVDQRMNDALNTASPPDLFFSANSAPSGLGELQLPLSHFINQTERLAWPNALWQQLQRGDAVYSLPVAAYPQVFLVNRQLLPQSGLTTEQLTQTGWNWSDLITAAERATDDQIKGYVPTSTGAALLRSLAASIGKPAPFDNIGNLIWTREDLLGLADIWLRLSRSNGVPTGGSEMDLGCLNLYLNQKVAIIGPVNHRLAIWLWQAAVGKGIEPMLALPPSVNLEGYSDTRALGISLFRQEPYQGDRHTRAAAELAQFITPKLGELLSELTGALPATEVTEPTQCVPFDQQSFQVYSRVDLAPPSAYSYGPRLGLSESHWQLAIAPCWERLVQGDFTAEQFAEAVLAELAMATVTGP